MFTGARIAYRGGRRAHRTAGLAGYRLGRKDARIQLEAARSEYTGREVQYALAELDLAAHGPASARRRFLVVEGDDGGAGGAA